MNIKGGVFAVVCSLGYLSLLNAQPITWQNDVVVEGNLDVGTSATKGNLSVTGETGNSAAPALNVTGDGGVLFQGSYDTGTLPNVQSGPFLLWYSKKAAFLASSGSTVVDTDIGVQSVALHGSANGDYSFAAQAGRALGDYSIAFGGSSSIASAMSSGTGSIAIGGAARANAFNSVVIGAGIANGDPNEWVETDPQFVVGYGKGKKSERQVFETRTR